jgi:signal transduction histidine kinase
MGTRGYAERGLEDWVMTLHTTVASMPLMQQMVATQQPIIVFDTQTDPNWVVHPETQWLRSLVGAPIRMRGWVIGSINLNSTEPHFFTQAHAERLQAFADQAAIAIENAFLYDSIRQSADELSVLYRASAQLIRPGADVETISMQMVSLLTEEFRIAHCAVYVHDEAANALNRAAHNGSDAGQAGLFLPMRSPALVTAAMHQAKTLYVTGPGLSEQYHDLDPDSKSAIAAPMSVGSHIIGVLSLESPNEAAFDMRTQRIVAAFAERAGLALENTQLLTRLDFARQTAEEASKLKSEFLANTSHELRTPLTGIIASLSMVLDNLCDSPEEEREFIQIAYSSSEHLHEIINSVLDIAKIEAGRMDVDLRAVDVAALFSEVYTLTRVQADDKNLKLEMRLPDDTSVRIQADPDKLRQILINLLGNSIKFTERGGIRVEADIVGEQMRMVVKDTGIGISIEKQARLFQPFVQGDGSMTRKYGGTGLGLSISRRFAEMMGGSLTLFSEGDGKGTTLTLLLPLARQTV